MQPEIKEALEAGPATGEDLGERARRILFPVTHRLAASLRKMVAAVLGIPAGSFRTFVRDTVRRVVTESLMELSFAGTLVLSLGRNLEYPSCRALEKPKDAEVLEFLARCEPPAGQRDDCGADDWADLPQRMHYIAHLFRAFQDRRDLFDTPFTSKQVEAFYGGQIPDGRL